MLPLVVVFPVTNVSMTGSGTAANGDSGDRGSKALVAIDGSKGLVGRHRAPPSRRIAASVSRLSGAGILVQVGND